MHGAAIKFEFGPGGDGKMGDDYPEDEDYEAQMMAAEKLVSALGLKGKDVDVAAVAEAVCTLARLEMEGEDTHNPGDGGY